MALPLPSNDATVRIPPPPITGLPRLPSFPCALPHQYCPGDDGNFHHNVASITSPACLLPSNIIGRMIAHFFRLPGWFLLPGIQPGGIRGPPSQWGLGSNPSQNMLGICPDWVKLFRALSSLVYSLKTLSIIGLKILGTGRNEENNDWSFLISSQSGISLEYLG